jgi:GT2 family glycosyltransferase
MDIAVVILNWNGKHLLEEYLPDVVQNSEEATIYVVDNASKDDSVAYLKQNHPNVKLIQLMDNQGYAGGYNIALEQVDEPIQILMNNDVRPAEGWLRPIIRCFQEEKDVAALQPKILADAQKDHFEYAGACGGYIDHLGYPYCRGRLFYHLEKDEGQYDDEVDVFWASGACLAFRKEIFIRVNGFDEDFFAHQEEIDLCWRIKNLGYQIKVVPTSVVYHLGGGTLNKLNPKKTYYNFRNSLFNLLKNAPHKYYKKLIIKRMLLDAIAFLHFFLLLRWKHAFMVLRAHFDYYGYKKRMLNKRRSSYTIDDYYHTKNIVFKFFVQRKKRFMDIN